MKSQIQSSWLEYHTWETSRWRSAIKRHKMSAPMRVALKHRIITTDTSVLDFGCGYNTDAIALKEMGIKAEGFDPYYRNDPSLLQPADVVSCIYVLNTIERAWEIPEVVQFCWELARESVFLAVRPGHDKDEYTKLDTHQHYWKPSSWQKFIQEDLGYDAEFPELCIALIQKPLTICYNGNVHDNISTTSNMNMNVKDLRKFLSVVPDKEQDGTTPITLEYEHGMLHLTYRKNGMLIKLPYALNGADDKWSTIVDHAALFKAISSIKSTEGISLSIDKGDLIVTVGKDNRKVSVSPWGKQLHDFDPEEMELDSQSIVCLEKHWADLVAAAKVARSNKKGVNPEIVGKAVQIEASGEFLSVSAWSESVTTHRTFPLQGKLTENRSFVLPLEAIEAISAMKSSQITMTLNYTFDQLMIETDIGYVLVDIPQTKYPLTDGIGKGGFHEATVEVKKKDLLAAIKAAVEAGAKNVTLVFDNEIIVVEAAKTKKQEIPAEIAEGKKKFTASVKIAAGALLDALKVIGAAKVFLHFPSAGNATSFLMNTVTGAMYVFAATVKVAACVIETAADVLQNPEPKREVIVAGKNSDGSGFVLEAVEASPLQKDLTPEEVEENRAKLEQKYGSKSMADVAEAALEVADLREKVRGITEDINTEIEKLRSLPQDVATVQRIAELLVLYKRLSSIVSDAENAEAALDLDTYVSEFSLEGLKEISFKLTWWGGRTVTFLFAEEAQWLPRMRFTEPVAH